MSILIMALIYVNLLFIPSLLHGAIARVNSQFEKVYTSNIVASPKSDTGIIRHADATLSRIREVPGVHAATGTYLAGSLLSYRNTSGSWQIYAVDPVSFQQVFQNNFRDGTFLSSGDTGGIVLGDQIAGNGMAGTAHYAATLHTVPVGATVRVTLNQGIQIPLTVKGVIDNQFQLADLRAFISYRTLDRYAPGFGTNATSLYIETEPGADTNKIIDQLRKREPQLTFLTPDSVPGSITDQVETIGQINNIFSVISLVVAAITVFIVTYVDLINRRRVIGIERAIGISPMAIILNYCLRALAYATFGILLGAVVYRSLLIPYFNRHPFSFPNGPVSLLDQRGFILKYTYIMVAVALISAWLPSWRSVKIKILDAIWK